MQIKAAISEYLKCKDAAGFALALAGQLRGTGQAAEVGKALEAYVRTAGQLLFRKTLQVCRRARWPLPVGIPLSTARIPLAIGESIPQYPLLPVLRQGFQQRC